MDQLLHSLMVCVITGGIWTVAESSFGPKTAANENDI